MSINTRKVITSIFVLIFLIGTAGSLMAAGQKDAQTEPAESGSPQKYAKQLDIVMIGFNPPGFPSEGANELEPLIEAKYNVNLTIEKLDIFNTEMMNLYFAEGKSPDFISLVSNIDWRNLVPQGVLRSIPEEFLSNYTPGWMKKMEALVGAEILAAQMKYQGKVYGLPTTNYAQGARDINGIRKDWLDNIGISQMPETLDELFAIGKQFANDDPDGNGKKDTFLMHSPQRTVFAAYGIQQNVYEVVAGKVRNTSISDEYKAALKVLASWYAAGLIDPEFVTDDTNMMKQKLREGRYGFVAAHPWFFCETTQADWNYPRIAAEGNPNAKIAFTPPIQGPSGMSGGWSPYPNIWAVAGHFFGKNASDEKVIRMLQMKEDFATDWDFYARFQYGEKDVHYTIDGSGVYKYIPEMSQPDVLVSVGLRFFDTMPLDWDEAKHVLTPGDMSAYQISTTYEPSFGAYGTPIVAFAVSGTNESFTRYGAGIDTISNEFYLNAVSGRIDIDAEWENYTKNWLDSGGTQVIAEFQKLYDQ